MSHAQPVNYQAVDAGAGPAVGWGDGIFGCLNDMQVCLLGAFPLGCVQYLYAVRSGTTLSRVARARNPARISDMFSLRRHVRHPLREFLPSLSSPSPP